MKDRDAIEMMRRCAEEIRMLRKQVGQLLAKAEAFEALQSVLALMPKQAQGVSEDLAWRLDREIAELESADAETKG